MRKSKKFIFENGLDAFSYSIQFIFSVIVPTFISLANDEHLFFVVVMFINALGLTREYLLLFKFKKTGYRFWVERLVGTGISIAIALYSIIALIFFVNGTTNPVFKFLDIFCSVLFLAPGIISVLEGIIYIKVDFKDNVVKENIVKESFVVAGSNSRNV